MVESVAYSKTCLTNIRILVWKNTLILAISCLFLFTGLFPIIAVQSSLNSDQGLGTISLSAQTAFQILGSAFLSTAAIQKLGTKWTITLGSVLYLPYIGANFYPTWATLLPTTCWLGIGASLLWPAQITYLTKLTQFYAQHQIGSDPGTIHAKFFGIFFAFFLISNCIGNAVASWILGDDSTELIELGQEFSNSNFPQICGANYCNEELGISLAQSLEYSSFSNYTHRNGSQPDIHRIYTLCTFCLICELVAVILSGMFLDTLPVLGISEYASVHEKKSMGRVLVATFSNLKNPKQILLLPLSLYNGISNYFLYADFTKAFVTCPVGMEYVGYVISCHGIFSFASSFLFGWFSFRKARCIPFVVATFAHMIPIIVLLHWTPSDNDPMKQYILASSWGIGAGIWSSQISAYYGIVFANNLEPAIANLVLWNAFGQMLLYACSHLLCVTVKIYITIAFLTLGMLGFALVEIVLMLEDFPTSDSPNNEVSTVTSDDESHE